jgi:hypothetical protein
METRYVFVGGSRDGEVVTHEGELQTTQVEGYETYALDDPPIEVAIEGGFAYALRYHGLAAD